MGPYDFSKATDVKGSFNYWLNPQVDADYLKFGFSTDGTNFTCSTISGPSGGWAEKDMKLSGVKDQIVGHANVRFAFIFTSDSTTNYPEGVYIDDILLEKYE